MQEACAMFENPNRKIQHGLVRQYNICVIACFKATEQNVFGDIV